MNANFGLPLPASAWIAGADAIFMLFLALPGAAMQLL
ncbi:hypothetical protein HDC89_001944 [Herbaspirillum sp. SJZ102]|nr:hypothetical protein [Herbaspirillum sp. SJZ102]